MTIFEKIKSMTLEELANFVCAHYEECEAEDNRCPGYDYCRKGHKGTIDWLQEVLE